LFGMLTTLDLYNPAGFPQQADEQCDQGFPKAIYQATFPVSFFHSERQGNCSK
jgi:hypothetical protein